MARTLLSSILLLLLAEMVITKAMNFEKQNEAESIMQNGKNTKIISNIQYKLASFFIKFYSSPKYKTYVLTQEGQYLKATSY